MTKARYEIDMCSGPLPGKIMLFSLPLMATGVLQLLFNAADIIVVGKYAGGDALAAVGSNGAIINLLVNVFMGLSIGASAVVAKYYGAQAEQEVSETTHTAMLISFYCGFVVMAIGYFCATPILRWMDTPGDVLELASLYLKIYFLGMPGCMVYNFGAAVLRGIGDTRRPLIYLLISGIVNVALNLVLVVGFSMSVSGVAIATVVSQYLSAGLVLWCMFRTNGCYQLVRGEFAIHRDKLMAIMKIGVPAGLQGAIFSISNVLIQSAVNSFDSIAMAGNAAAANIEGFVFTCMNSVAQASLTFTSQNVGAGNWKRLRGVTLCCLALVTVVGQGLGMLAYYFGQPLLSIYSDDSAIIAMGMIRLGCIAVTYSLDGIMGVLAAIVRGMGNSLAPMFVTLIGACGLRVLWIYTVFAWNPDLKILYLSYPITWIISSMAHMVCYFITKKRLLRRAAITVKSEGGTP